MLSSFFSSTAQLSWQAISSLRLARKSSTCHKNDLSQSTFCINSLTPPRKLNLSNVSSLLPYWMWYCKHLLWPWISTAILNYTKQHSEPLSPCLAVRVKFNDPSKCSLQRQQSVGISTCCTSSIPTKVKSFGYPSLPVLCGTFTSKPGFVETRKLGKRSVKYTLKNSRVAIASYSRDLFCLLLSAP